ncbi:MAG TPA: ABC transporter permease [bacterium]|nr:ABC transporter permease [bacterium]HPN44805.1 ABC transporter permease [bacterium]
MTGWKNKIVIVAIFLLALIIISVLVAPLFARLDPVNHSLDETWQKPSLKHWFGTDKFGRDVFARVLYGGRISFLIAMLAMLLSLFIGIPYGLLSGYLGKKTDALLSWFINLFMAIPQFLLILTIIAILDKNSVTWVIIVIALFSWMDVARLVRNQTLTLKERDFILAAQVTGLSSLRILVRHILPNLVGSLVVLATLMLANIILIESALSFIGLGIQPPTPSWGNIINDGRQALVGCWWISIFPGLAIIFTVLCIHIIGEHIQEKNVSRY